MQLFTRWPRRRRPGVSEECSHVGLLPEQCEEGTQQNLNQYWQKTESANFNSLLYNL